MLRKSSNPSWSLLLLMWLLAAGSAFGQGTSFTYQGKLTDGSSPANGSYDFQFKLFDTAALGTGTEFGTAQTLTGVAVSSGIFTVQLDFGACPTCFTGAARFLEIAVRPTGGGSFTTLGPRQPFTSAPYALRSQSAAAADGLSMACVNCVTSSQIASVSGGAVSGAIPVESVPPGSGNYIQNTTTQQAASNFSISGSGVLGGTLSANSVDATTQYNIGGSRVLSVAGTENLFAGVNAGSSNTGGIWNSFFGTYAGNSNTTGRFNSFFGKNSGLYNTVGESNSFFGRNSGSNNTTGSFNSFFGRHAGESNTAGNYNTIIGPRTNVGAGDLVNATALGSHALVSCNNCLVLGSINGVNDATSDVNVGIGITGPAFKLHVIDGSNTGLRVQTNSDFGTVASFGGKGDFQIDAPGVAGGRFVVKEDGRVGIGTSSPALIAKLHVQGGLGYGVYGSSDISAGVYGDSISGVGVYGTSFSGYAGLFSGHVNVSGVLSVGTLESAGTTALCRNASNQITFCSSSLRYKTDVGPFSGGLDILNRLRPIAFTWKQGGMPDIGLAAEEVEKVEPLLITHNDKGEVEGVKYDRVAVVLVNAVKEQQAQIAQQRRQLAQQVEHLQRQQAQIDALKKQVCLDHPAADVCR